MLLLWLSYYSVFRESQWHLRSSYQPGWCTRHWHRHVKAVWYRFQRVFRGLGELGKLRKLIKQRSCCSKLRSDGKPQPWCFPICDLYRRCRLYRCRYDSAVRCTTEIRLGEVIQHHCRRTLGKCLELGLAGAAASLVLEALSLALSESINMNVSFNSHLCITSY